jgi:hypothetical protein
MNDLTKIGSSHLGRAAYVYLCQSSPAQVEHNRESTQRQYALVDPVHTQYRRRQSCGPHPLFVWHCNPTATINYKPREDALNR